MKFNRTFEDTCEKGTETISIFVYKMLNDRRPSSYRGIGCDHVAKDENYISFVFT